MKKSWIIPGAVAAVVVVVVASILLSAQDAAEPVRHQELPDGIGDATLMAVAVLEGEPSAIPDKVASANNEFAIDLYRELPGDDANVFFCTRSGL